MDTRVVLDYDWLIINQKPYIKQLAFCVVDEKSGRKDDNSHMFTFELPPTAAEHGRDAFTQADLVVERILRSARGSGCFSALFDSYLTTKPADVYFYAKSLQKCHLLENSIPNVQNLEDLGCSRLDQLTDKEHTIQNKAELFAGWLHDQKSETSSPPAPSDAAWIWNTSKPTFL
ncbi:hypothetical protein RvY_16136 [Ramazzottius varieornatus]|uniref:Uncharacterized protein n=1 Tax=Ramazzottius varieornatus TaxID=947166 RepID=A0A1D1W3X7_RAMVA|nr:hypothetical protein RvY_16136 [Ramazzottius varieornatus]